MTKDIFVISDLETLKVVSEPLRLRIIEASRGSPRTVKEIAADLELSATRLYYHVNLLEQHGLLRVVETRIVSGIIEKHYQTTADRLTVDRALLTADRSLQDDGLDVLLSVILDEAQAEIRRSVREGRIDIGRDAPFDRSLVLGRRWTRLTLDQAQAFLDRFTQLSEEFDQIAAGNGEDVPTYELLLGFYPVERRPLDALTSATQTFAADAETDEPAH